MDVAVLVVQTAKVDRAVDADAVEVALANKAKTDRRPAARFLPRQERIRSFKHFRIVRRAVVATTPRSSISSSRASGPSP